MVKVLPNGPFPILSEASMPLYPFTYTNNFYRFHHIFAKENTSPLCNFYSVDQILGLKAMRASWNRHNGAIETANLHPNVTIL